MFLFGLTTFCDWSVLLVLLNKKGTAAVRTVLTSSWLGKQFKHTRNSKRNGPGLRFAFLAGCGFDSSNPSLRFANSVPVVVRYIDSQVDHRGG